MRSIHIARRLLICAGLLCAATAAQAQDGLVPPGLELQRVAGGFNRPLAVRDPGDGSERLYVVEQAGRIWVLDRRGIRFPVPFLNIVDRVEDGANEEGLLGLAFHPEFASNGLFFVNYVRDVGQPGRSPAQGDLHHTIISRFTALPGNPLRADPESEKVIIEFEQPFRNHNAGDLHFGPDGYLYIATGDGGGGNDPENNAQNVNNLLGKILRIDTAGRGVSGLCGMVRLYAAPPDNPFVGRRGCDEIWAYGLRNPFRFSFDRGTGDMLIADVGQNAREEINWQPGGAAGGQNYGWDCLEGARDNRSAANNPVCTPLPEAVSPVIEHPHPEFRSITGGYVYRGPGRGWRGRYVYADFITGRIWFAMPSGQTNWNAEEWRDTGMLISSFGEDEAGNLYLTDFASGALYRFASVIYRDGFE